MPSRGASGFDLARFPGGQAKHPQQPDCRPRRTTDHRRPEVRDIPAYPGPRPGYKPFASQMAPISTRLPAHGRDVLRRRAPTDFCQRGRRLCLREQSDSAVLASTTARGRFAHHGATQFAQVPRLVPGQGRHRSARNRGSTWSCRLHGPKSLLSDDRLGPGGTSSML